MHHPSNSLENNFSKEQVQQHFSIIGNDIISANMQRKFSNASSKNNEVYDKNVGLNSNNPEHVKERNTIKDGQQHINSGGIGRQRYDPSTLPHGNLGASPKPLLEVHGDILPTDIYQSALLDSIGVNQMNLDEKEGKVQKYQNDFKNDNTYHHNLLIHHQQEKPSVLLDQIHQTILRPASEHLEHLEKLLRTQSQKLQIKQKRPNSRRTIL